jgi:hypothetical protein
MRGPVATRLALCLMSQVYQPSKLNLRGKLFQKQPRFACLEIRFDPKRLRDELTEAAAKLGIAIFAPDLNGPDELLARYRFSRAKELMLPSYWKPRCFLACATIGSAIYGYREHVQAGGLISYGVDLV